MLKQSCSPCASRQDVRAFTTRLPTLARRTYKPRFVCQADDKQEADTTSRTVSTSSTDDEFLPRPNIRAQAPPQSNIIQGALEEAQLITWPSPSKAFFDTILVLGLVSVSAGFLFGLNVVLAEASEWWYHR